MDRIQAEQEDASSSVAASSVLSNARKATYKIFQGLEVDFGDHRGGGWTVQGVQGSGNRKRVVLHRPSGNAVTTELLNMDEYARLYVANQKRKGQRFHPSPIKLVYASQNIAGGIVQILSLDSHAVPSKALVFVQVAGSPAVQQWVDARLASGLVKKNPSAINALVNQALSQAHDRIEVAKEQKKTSAKKETLATKKSELKENFRSPVILYETQDRAESPSASDRKGDPASLWDDGEEKTFRNERDETRHSIDEQREKNVEQSKPQRSETFPEKESPKRDGSKSSTATSSEAKPSAMHQTVHGSEPPVLPKEFWPKAGTVPQKESTRSKVAGADLPDLDVLTRQTPSNSVSQLRELLSVQAKALHELTLPKPVGPVSQTLLPAGTISVPVFTPPDISGAISLASSGTYSDGGRVAFEVRMDTARKKVETAAQLSLEQLDQSVEELGQQLDRASQNYQEAWRGSMRDLSKFVQKPSDMLKMQEVFDAYVEECALKKRRLELAYLNQKNFRAYAQRWGARQQDGRTATPYDQMEDEEMLRNLVLGDVKLEVMGEELGKKVSDTNQLIAVLQSKEDPSSPVTIPAFPVSLQPRFLDEKAHSAQAQAKLSTPVRFESTVQPSAAAVPLPRKITRSEGIPRIPTPRRLPDTPVSRVSALDQAQQSDRMLSATVSPSSQDARMTALSGEGGFLSPVLPTIPQTFGRNEGEKSFQERTQAGAAASQRFLGINSMLDFSQTMDDQDVLVTKQTGQDGEEEEWETQEDRERDQMYSQMKTLSKFLPPSPQTTLVKAGLALSEKKMQEGNAEERRKKWLRMKNLIRMCTDFVAGFFDGANWADLLWAGNKALINTLICRNKRWPTLSKPWGVLGVASADLAIVSIFFILVGLYFLFHILPFMLIANIFR